MQGKGKVLPINELSVVYFPYQENCHDQCLCLTLFATLANLPLLENFHLISNKTKKNWQSNIKRKIHNICLFHIAWLSLNFELKTSWVVLHSVVCQSGKSVRHRRHPAKSPLFQYIYTDIKALYWSCTTKYEAVPTWNDPIPPSTREYRHILTQYNQVPTVIVLWFIIS